MPAQTLNNSVGVMLAYGSWINKFTRRTRGKNSAVDLTSSVNTNYKHFAHMLGDTTDLFDLSSGFWVYCEYTIETIVSQSVYLITSSCEVSWRQRTSFHRDHSMTVSFSKARTRINENGSKRTAWKKRTKFMETATSAVSYCSFALNPKERNHYVRLCPSKFSEPSRRGLLNRTSCIRMIFALAIWTIARGWKEHLT